MRANKFVYNVKRNTSKGQVALSITFIIMSFMLFTALFMASESTKEIKVVGNVNSSAKSFYASDSGAERFLYEINAVGSIAEIVPGEVILTETLSMDDGAYATFRVEGVSATKIKSVGVFTDTNRAIELTYQ